MSIYPDGLDSYNEFEMFDLSNLYMPEVEVESNDDVKDVSQGEGNGSREETSSVDPNPDESDEPKKKTKASAKKPSPKPGDAKDEGPVVSMSKDASGTAPRRRGGRPKKAQQQPSDGKKDDGAKTDEDGKSSE